MKNLGKFLVDKYVITEYELSCSEKIMQSSGSSLVDVILSEGYINPQRLYGAIAQYYKTEFADLIKNPCDVDVVNNNCHEDYFNLRAIPWKKNGDKVIIAACDITPELKQWASDKFEKYDFVITSPFDIRTELARIFAENYNDDALEMLSRAHPDYSAKNLFKGIQCKIFLVSLLLLIPLCIWYPKQSLAVVFLVSAFFYTFTILFKTLLFAIGMKVKNEADANTQVIDAPHNKLPVYTILVPLYKEERVLKKLTESIRAFDYPKSKLDVKLIVESDDDITIDAIKALRLPRMFEMIKVPYSLPRTKPKACNYALRFARGDFVTIYDAEDIPDPKQLKKVLYEFANSSDDLACVQAKLNFFNRDENLLAKLFSIEYSSLFEFLLYGLEFLKIPIPLGGTSNHFRVRTLKELYAWDPYNVTEDADLGLRIAQKGWRCKIIDSTTMEECPISLSAWIRQRSRWIKGHMQTYFVHMRKPFRLFEKTGLVGFMGVQFFLGAPALIFLISPIMWTIWALFVSGILNIPAGMPYWFNYVINYSSILLVFGVIIQLFYAFVVVSYQKWPRMGGAIVMFPFYWVLHSVASFKALWQLITKPYYWEKTNHGLTEVISG